MTVRRLAEPAVQPPSFVFNGAMQPQVETWIAKYPAGRQQSAVIPLLMLAQEQEGWVTKAAIEAVADMLDMPYIRVLEVATFYTQFQLKPVGTKAHIQVCGTTPCMIRGAGALMDVCRSKIHHDQFHTNESGTLSWEEVECQGTCVNAPMVMVFKDTYEDLTPERLAAIIDDFEAGNPPVPGPQVDRILSAPAGGLTSLNDEKAIEASAREWREKRLQAATAEAATGGPGEASAPPSEAARPKTDAAETNPAIKSPSPVKTKPAGEKAESVEAPKANADAANIAEPAVEKTVKQRRRKPVASSEDESLKSPELHKGKSVGAGGKGAAAQDAGEPGIASAGTDKVAKPARKRAPKAPKSESGES